jgi:hypothetical protein
MGDNDFPAVMANGGWADAKDKASKWLVQPRVERDRDASVVPCKERYNIESHGNSYYSQSGTDIPSGSMYSRSSFSDGSGRKPRGFEEFGITPSLLG